MASAKKSTEKKNGKSSKGKAKSSKAQAKMKSLKKAKEQLIVEMNQVEKKAKKLKEKGKKSKLKKFKELLKNLQKKEKAIKKKISKLVTTDLSKKEKDKTGKKTDTDKTVIDKIALNNGKVDQNQALADEPLSFDVDDDLESEKSGVTLTINKSTDMSTRDAVIHIRKLNNLEEITDFILGDNRITVIRAADARKRKLNP